MLAHYMDDKEFTNVLLTEDIHTRNQLAAGLETRPQAKTFIYAFLYGAGDAKIGTIVGGSAKDWRTILNRRFLSKYTFS
jgi:DNA polymerase-1